MGDSVHPIDVLLRLSPANGQAKVMSGRCGTAETPNMCNTWYATVMLNHSNIEFYMLQDLIKLTRPVMSTSKI